MACSFCLCQHFLFTYKVSIRLIIRYYCRWHSRNHRLVLSDSPVWANKEVVNSIFHRCDGEYFGNCMVCSSLLWYLDMYLNVQRPCFNVGIYCMCWTNILEPYCMNKKKLWFWTLCVYLCYSPSACWVITVIHPFFDNLWENNFTILCINTI